MNPDPVPKLVFCFPYRGVGGVSLLFLRVAEELARRGLAECLLVDYADGFMASHRREGLTTLLEYRDDRDVPLPPDGVAIFQSMTPWSIYPSLRMAPEMRLLFWNCYLFNLIPALPGLRGPMQAYPVLADALLATILRRYRSQMRTFTRLLLERHSLAFMDRGNVATTERYLGLRVPDPSYLPIAAVSQGERPQREPRDVTRRGLRIAWLGRIVDFKFHVLDRALRDLDRLQPRLGFPMSVTVIGEGDHEAALKQRCARLRHLDVRFQAFLAPDRVDHFLGEEVDLLLAMGTSALEGAKLGVPTILLDASYRTVPDGYLYRWLHEAAGFSLGEVLGPEHFVPGNTSLEDHLACLRKDHATVAEQALRYFERNHAVKSVAEQVLERCAQARCTNGDLEAAGLLDRGVVYPVFTFLRSALVRA